MKTITFECFRKDCIKKYNSMPRLDTFNIFSIIEEIYNTEDFDIHDDSETIDLFY